jgi:hypothetical protein
MSYLYHSFYDDRSHSNRALILAKINEQYVVFDLNSQTFDKMNLHELYDII